jgi:hypothetical protein
VKPAISLFESYIAEPYSREARAGFIQYAERVKVSLAHPPVEVPASVGSSAAWVTYRSRACELGFDGIPEAVSGGKDLPAQSERRSRRDACGVEGFGRTERQGQDVDPSLQIIRKLDKEGLLEAFILLALPDEGIASDFVAYRQTNIDKLRRYVKQYVLTGGGQ